MGFSKNFLWGASISAFQAEGAYREDGKGLTVADIRSFRAREKNKIADTSITSDFYHKYKEDISLMRECGLKSFRFSVSWARIYPEGRGEINQAGIDFYNRVINELTESGIEPIVTLFHFDYPQALIDKYGGFCSRESIADFLTYAKTCFQYFGDRVKYWLTINEEDVLANIPEFLGADSKKKSWQAYHHMNLANAQVMKLYHAMKLPGKIGPCVSYCTVYPATLNPKDQLLAYEIEQIYTFSILEVLIYGKYPKYMLNYLEKKGLGFETQPGDEELLEGAEPDYLGLNWYTTEVVGQYVDEKSFGDYEGPELPRRRRAEPGFVQYYQNPYTKYCNPEWNTDGDGFRLALRKMYERYHLPLMITENGVSLSETLEDGCVHDAERIEYLKEMVNNMELAVEDGVELLGYNPWSFIDLNSSSQGVNKRYGLVYVDRTNEDARELKRYRKDSFYWYQECIRRNGA